MKRSRRVNPNGLKKADEKKKRRNPAAEMFMEMADEDTLLDVALTAALAAAPRSIKIALLEMLCRLAPETMAEIGIVLGKKIDGTNGTDGTGGADGAAQAVQPEGTIIQ